MTDIIEAPQVEPEAEDPYPLPEPDTLPARTGAVGSVTGDLPVIPERNETTAIAQLANTLAYANACPSALRGKPNDVFLVLLTARDLGVSLTTAMREFHVIEGKVTLSPKVKLALVRRSGLGRIWPDAGNDESQATWHGERTDMPGVVVSSTFTLEDARQAGLDGKQNWRNYPGRMLSWRAAGFLLDDLFAEVGTGLYQPDELGAVTDAEGQPIEVTAVESLPGLRGGRVPDAAPAETLDPETLALLRVRLDRVKVHPDASVELRAWWSERELPNVSLLSPAQARTLTAKVAQVEVAHGLLAEKPGGEPVEAPEEPRRQVPPPTVPESPGGAESGSQGPLVADGDVSEAIIAEAGRMTAGDIRLAFVHAGVDAPRGKVDELRRAYAFWRFEQVAVGLLALCSGFALGAGEILAANVEAS